MATYKEVVEVWGDRQKCLFLEHDLSVVVVN